MLGNGTIFEGYAATKLMRAGFRTNNLSERAAIAWPQRPSPSCAPSAWTSRWGATTTSSTPTPSCSGDRTWRRCTRSYGARVTHRRLCAPHIPDRDAVDLTSTARSTSSDVPIIFKPGTDLAILNYIANYIIQTGAAKRFHAPNIAQRACAVPRRLRLPALARSQPRPGAGRAQVHRPRRGGASSRTARHRQNPPCHGLGRRGAGFCWREIMDGSFGAELGTSLSAKRLGALSSGTTRATPDRQKPCSRFAAPHRSKTGEGKGPHIQTRTAAHVLHGQAGHYRREGIAV